MGESQLSNSSGSQPSGEAARPGMAEVLREETGEPNTQLIVLNLVLQWQTKFFLKGVSKDIMGKGWVSLEVQVMIMFF